MNAAQKQILVAVDPRSFSTHEVEWLAGVEEFVAARGLPWKVVGMKHVPPDLMIGGRRVDGVIGRATPQTVQLVKRRRVPMVNILGSAAPAKVPSVIADYEAAGQMAADFFLERGLRRFGFLGANLRYSQRLQTGFMNRIKAAGGTCVCETVDFQYDETLMAFNRFQRKVNAFIERLSPPVGILLFEDLAGHYISNACAERGLALPDAVAVIGLGNNFHICSRMTPAMTSVDCNFCAVGFGAAELLERLMAGAKPPRQPILVPPRAIVPRRSTEHLFVDDPTVAQALRIISERHTGRLRPQDVAQRVFISLRTLQRRFKTSLGRSVIGEINRQRIRHARHLLIDGDALVKEIAHECGFPDAQQFGRAFADVEGMTPSEYRRVHRN